MTKPLKIGLVVGEASGASIAKGMVSELLRRHPRAEIVGIGSKSLNELGMRSLFDMEELSVMGLTEVLKHLPRLLRIRKTIIKYFIENPPDVFIGVDAPDFNLPVERKLKRAGIPTVHYVSPTIWAWREKRIHKIAAATNLVLGVFPFEKLLYESYKVPYRFVGHTTADQIPLAVDQISHKKTLSLDLETPYLAILPGSRSKEVETLLPIFIETYQKLLNSHPNMGLIIPAANTHRKIQIQTILTKLNVDQNVIVTDSGAQQVMLASEAVLLASGTAALEAMLCKKPMVVAYKMSALTYLMMKRMYKPKYFALPNILASDLIVPEFLQEDVNSDNLSEHLRGILEQNSSDLKAKFNEIHQSLCIGADLKSADAVLSLIKH